MRHVCVFDVNETLLDLSALDPHFERAFGDAGARGAWFGQLIQSALVSIITDHYVDFGTIAGAALTMVARRRGKTLTDDERSQILSALRALPPHPEVAGALEHLRAQGFRLAALTNSTAAVATAQLQHAGLVNYFEHILSADATKRLKPASEAYHAAAHALGVAPSNVRLIAAHAWDVAGALRAGCAAAFVARPGMVLDPLVEPPDIVGADLRKVVTQIIARDA